MKTKDENHFVKEHVFIFILQGFELFAILLLVFLSFNFSSVIGVVGQPNATVASTLNVGAAAPIINNITFFPTPITLIPASTQTVNCSVEIFDNEGQDNIDNVYAEFFDSVISSFGGSDDNNSHYTNSSCDINLTYGDAFTVLANCLFEVYYYANPGSWNCTVNVTDFSGFETISSNATTVSDLIALGVPDAINYGTVNALEVSGENATNVTNYGNVQINLSLEGYAQSQGDGNAMNCSLGSVGTIPIAYEKYNLTAANTENLTLSQFEANYTNLTTLPTIRNLGLNYRQNDTFNEAMNTTYWRIYIPTGVAGNCTGNIIFGATQADGS